MALSFQSIDVPFTGALDKSFADHLLSPGAQFLRFENAQMTRLGRVTPRPCFSSKPFSFPVGIKAERLISHDGALLVIASRTDQLASRAGIYTIGNDSSPPEAGYSGYVGGSFVGPLPEYTAERRPRIRNPAGDVTDADMAEGTRFIVYAWRDESMATNGGKVIRIRLVDKQTGSVAYDQNFPDHGLSGFTIRVTHNASSNIALITWRMSNRIKYISVRTDMFTMSDVGEFDDSYVPNVEPNNLRGWYDIAPGPNGTWYLMTARESGIMVTRYSAAMVILGEVLFAPTGLEAYEWIMAIKHFSTPTPHLWIAYFVTDSTQSGIRVRQYSEDLGTVITTEKKVIITGQEIRPSFNTDCGSVSIEEASAGVLTVAFSDQTTKDLSIDSEHNTEIVDDLRFNTVTSAGVVGTTLVLERCVLRSKLWSTSDRRVMGVVADRKSATYYALELVTSPSLEFDGYCRPVTSLAYQTAYTNPTDADILPGGKLPHGKLLSVNVNAASGNVRVFLPVWVSVLTGKKPEDPNRDKRVGWDDVLFTRFDSRAYQTAVLDGILYISGGCLMEYDGVQCYENGFLQDPWCKLYWDPGHSGTYDSPAFGAGTYSACLCYDWWDAKGRRHRSQPSLPSVYTVNTHPNTWYSIERFSFTYRQERHGRVLLSPYMTQTNGVTHYRMKAWEDYPGAPVFSSLPGPVVAVSEGLVNHRNGQDGDMGLGNFGSDVPDPSMEMLYAPPDGTGEAPNLPLYGGCTHLVAHKNRLFAASAEEPTKLYYSKECVPGVAVGWYGPGYEIDCGERITGLVSLGDALIVFSERQIKFISGDGPDSAGKGGAFSIPQKIPADAGCICWQSIVTFERGVLFLSARGMMLLDTGLGITYLGDAVQEELKNRTVTDSMVDPVAKHARLLLDSGAWLVCDYSTPGTFRWYLWTHATAPRSTCFHNEHHMFFDEVGKLFTQDDFVIADDNNLANWMPVTLETGWLTFGQLARYKRLQRLGVVCVRHSVGGVSLSISSEEGASEVRSWSEAEIATRNTQKSLALIHHLGAQLSKGYKLTIQSTAPAALSTVAPAFEWVGLTALVGMRSKGIQER